MIGNTWDTLLRNSFAADEFTQLTRFLDERYATGVIYPPRDRIFTALTLTPPEAVRAVIVGQDPYIRPGQAQGLAFSVPPGEPLPPSLKNIFKEMQSDLGQMPATGCLFSWAQQGVLLLNTVLTVEAGQSASHQGKGWESFTDSILRILGAWERPLAFVLWGAPAQKKEAFIQTPSHLVLKAPHPSPLSAHRGFFGSRPFSKVNTFLESCGQMPIQWF